MTSTSLQQWQSSRRQRLDELFALPPDIDVEQRSLALLVRLAAEWRGFARDLHDEATDSLVDWAGSRAAAKVALVLRSLLTGDRRLTGGADESALDRDFARLGVVALWELLDAADERHGVTGRGQLRRLLQARDGLVADDQATLSQLRREGFALDLPTAARWRQALDDLATDLDGVVADHLAALLGIPRPW